MTYSEAEILELLKLNFDNIRNGRSNPSKEKKILRTIRKIKSSSNPELCVMIAQWMVMYHMSGFSKSENPKQIESLMKNAETDLSQALKLLEIKISDETLAMHSLLITADIAQKLAKFDKLDKVYKEIISKSSLNPQLSFIALSIAPSMADWNLFYHLCLLMEKEYNAFASKSNVAGPGRPANMIEALHQLADAGMPDLGLIYSYVKEHKLYNRKTPPANKLFEQTIEIESISMEILEISAENEEKEKEIREDFEREKETEFNMEGLAMAVNGGVILFPGLSREVPQMLYGPYFDENRIDVEGYTDLQMQKTVDENGNPLGSPSSPDLEAEVMKNMPPEMLDAINSGDLSPEMLMQLMSQAGALGGEGTPNQFSANSSSLAHMLPPSSPTNNEELQRHAATNDFRESFAEFARNMSENGSEMMKKYGISLVRQQERLELHRCEGGYEGIYFVRNYNPIDLSEDVSIKLSVQLKCAHFIPPPMALNEDDIEKINSGIDDLVLE